MNYRLNDLNNWFFKTIYRNFFPRAYRHNKNFWPHFTLERDSDNKIKNVFYKRNQIFNKKKLHEKIFSDKKCQSIAIVATGPSINDIDVNFFYNKNIDFIGVNGAISLGKEIFKYYVIIDTTFINNRFNLVMDVISNKNIIFFTTPSCIDQILKKIKVSSIVCDIYIIETSDEKKLNIERFLERLETIDKTDTNVYFDKNGFSLDISNYIFDYHTVAYSALQVCYYLNYKTIYMLGVDMNNLNKPRFYEKKNNILNTSLDYHMEDILSAFDVANDVFEKNGISVFNLSVNSRVDAFKKLDYRNIN